MIALGIDTSTSATSVALLDGDDVIASERHVDARAHAEVLAPLVDSVMRTARVGAAARPDLIAVGVGPGPYTGLRVGIATARMLGLAWDIPVVGVCSLDALAVGVARSRASSPSRASVTEVADAPGDAHVATDDAVQAAADLRSATIGIPDTQPRSGPVDAFVVATDARRKEVYWASYDATGHRLDGPFVSRVADIPADVRALPWLGEGVTSAPGNADLVDAVALDALVTPEAADVARLAVAWTAAGIEPAAPPAQLSEHGTDDGSTARSLAGLTLLQPYPLYVRRADAAAPTTLMPSTLVQAPPVQP